MYSQEEAEYRRLENEVYDLERKNRELESEVERLKSQLDEEEYQAKQELTKEEERTRECQREISRLRKIVKTNNFVCAEITNPDYEKLFELWLEFDDDDSPAEVKAKSQTLAQFDMSSFLGFCAGFAAAGKILKED